MVSEHPQLWRDLPPQMRQVVLKRVEQRLPQIAQDAMTTISENIDSLIDVKLMVVGRLRENPVILKNIIYDLGAKELRFMTRLGFTLGAPLGLILALILEYAPHTPVLRLVPPWLLVVGGGALIGIIVNLIAIKMVFEPGEPAPRYRYLWKQAKFAKRQHEAAASFGHSLAYDVITLPNIANELLHGPRSDKTRWLIESIMRDEVDKIMGPVRAFVRVAIGSEEFDAIRSGTAEAAVSFAPRLSEDLEFSKKQAIKIDTFCTTKLRELPPEEFMEMLYSAVEQDAWLLYAHGGLLGLVVGLIHLIIFGA
jgi:uncharacterized membrane protein YheB (UPF0754 family)